TGPIEGDFVAATTRFDHKSGLPLNSIMLVSCRHDGSSYTFLFGVSGAHYAQISLLSNGDRVSLEQQGSDILVNRIPVERFYKRTINGLVELAGSGLKRLTGQRPPGIT
ncbi:MAG TPA: thiolase family protein, partial [Geobacteraceae bacterium]|nr:thiolase family protein [Geobacteraceae bacterium]